MTTNFPSSIDAFTNPTSADTLDNPPHDQQHADINDAMEAVQTSLLDGAPLFIDDANERVGIGTTEPGQALDVRGRIVANYTDNAFPLSVQSGQSTSGIILADAGTTSNVVLRSNGDDFQIRTNASDRVTVDSSGNVGIGTTTPDNKLHVQIGASAAPASVPTSHIIIADSGESTDSGMAVYSSTTGNGYFRFGDSDNAARGGFRYEHSADKMYFRTGGTDKGAIDSSGRVGIGNTAPTEKLQVAGNIRIDGDLTIEGYTNTGQPSGNIISYASGSVAAWSSGCTSDGTRYHMRFSSPSYSAIGAIYTSSGNTYYANYSDYRLKDNVVPLANAGDIVTSLNPISYTMRYSPEVTHLGFLAHELQEHIPSAVAGQKDEVDDEGNPVYQSVDLSKVVPVLTAALQEALNTISDLTARIEALENPPEVN
jgi:hypothetical protein